MSETRWCQCGKQAGHGSVCRDTGTPAGLTPDDIERVDGTWEEAEARRREDRFEQHKRGTDAERRQQRAEMSLIDLHRHALERATKLSTVAAGNPEPGRGHADSSIPARPQTLDDDPRWRERWSVMRSCLERAHELLDEAEGLGPVASTSKLLGEEKDARILKDGAGLDPVAVVEKLGRDIAGSPETVRRVRRKAAVSAKDGTTPITARPSAAHRRVVIDSQVDS